jgi:uncharacterized protein YjbI with pentapeptide repeats
MKKHKKKLSFNIPINYMYNAKENIRKKKLSSSISKNKGFQNFNYELAFRVVTVVITTLIAVITVFIAVKANRLLEIQNKRIEQQTYLAESERISSLFFELTSIYNKIDQEYNIARTNGINEKNIILSNQLTGRIVSISQALKPYRFLNLDGELCMVPLSPEKGQLLTTLLKAKVDINQFSDEADFSYTDLSSKNLSHEVFDLLDLGFSNFDNSVFFKSEFRRTDLSNTSMYNTKMNETKFHGVFLNDATISTSEFFEAEFLDITSNKTTFTRSKFIGAKFHYSRIDSVVFFDCDLSLVDFLSSSISNSNFNNSILPEATYFNNAKLINNNFNGAMVTNEHWLQQLKKAIDKTKSEFYEKDWLLIKSSIEIEGTNNFYYQIKHK